MKPLAMLLSAFLIQISTVAIAGPFGFDWNSRVLPSYCRLNKFNRYHQASYVCNLPVSLRHSFFRYYNVEFHEKTGICEINSFDMIDFEEHGYNRDNEKFSIVREELENKYGLGEFKEETSNSFWETKDTLTYTIKPNMKNNPVQQIKLRQTLVYERKLFSKKMKWFYIDLEYTKKPQGVNPCYRGWILKNNKDQL